MIRKLKSRTISSLFPQDQSEDRQAPQPRHVPDPGEGRAARTRGAILQTPCLSRRCWSVGQQQKLGMRHDQGSTRKSAQTPTIKEMVSGSHTQQQRTRSGEQGLCQKDTARNRPLAQALGRAQRPPQVVTLSVRYVDADILINRAGKNLPESRLHVLQRAKGQLRKAFERR